MCVECVFQVIHTLILDQRHRNKWLKFYIIPSIFGVWLSWNPVAQYCHVPQDTHPPLACTLCASHEITPISRPPSGQKGTNSQKSRPQAAGRRCPASCAWENTNSLTDNIAIFLTSRWSPALKKTRKQFLSLKTLSKYLLSIFIFYLRRLFWKICSTRPQYFGGLQGKSKKKA